MPAKDASKTIGSAITSVVRCIPDDSEIVVWDDGSTDATGEVAEAVGRGSVRIFRSDVNVGGGIARQRLLEMTDSEFVVNMDADDITLPWRFRMQLPHMQQADFCFAGSFRFEGRNIWHKPSLPLNYNDVESRASLAIHNGMTHPTLIARRAVLDAVGGYGQSPVAQDYELWMRAAAQGAKFWRVGIPCIGYRLSPSQVSRQEGYVRRILNRQEIYSSYLRLLESLLPDDSKVISGLTNGESSQHIVGQLLPKLLGYFRPHLRQYYSKLLSAKPNGPFSDAKIQ